MSSLDLLVILLGFGAALSMVVYALTRAPSANASSAEKVESAKGSEPAETASASSALAAPSADGPEVTGDSDVRGESPHAQLPKTGSAEASSEAPRPGDGAGGDGAGGDGAGGTGGLVAPSEREVPEASGGGDQGERPAAGA